MNNIFVNKEDINLLFDEEKGNLKQVAYKDNLIEFSSTLWRVEIKKEDNTEYCSIKDMKEFYYKNEENDLNLFWENKFLRVKVSISTTGSKLVWRILTESLSDKYYINRVVFPVIGCIKPISEEGENDYLLLPWQNGWLIKDPIHTLINKKDEIPFWLGRGGYKYENEYPAQYSYQFAAYYSPGKYGYYFSTEDSDVYIKTMGFYYDRVTDGFNFAITNYPENMGSTKYYSMPYEFVLDFFEGDWQAAANMYREWAVNQKWCREKLKDRYLPEKLKDIDLWRINHMNYALGIRTQEYFDTSVMLKEKLDCNLALHWYGWNMAKEHGFNYPEMLEPENREWLDKLTEWNNKFYAAGILKIPYVNVHLWDSCLQSWKDENASEVILKKETGELIEEPWIDGRLKPICHATQKLKNIALKLFAQLINENKFDGLYIDQVASYNATLCFDRSHPHPVGGGKWWNEEYHTIIRTLRNIIGSDRILTTESCCETYIDAFDLFLILDTNLQEAGFCEVTAGENCEPIPLFSMIYGDYALSYGSICRFSDTLEAFELKFMRNILWGILPCIEGADMDELNSENASGYIDILRKGVDFFKRNKELVLYGRLAAIPCYKSENIKIMWDMEGKSYEKEYPKVMAAVWEDVDDKSVYLLYNFDNNEQHVSINEIDICLPAKSFKAVNP